MAEVGQEQIFADLVSMLDELSDDWEYSGEVTIETSFFEDLGFESIDVVALGTAIEEYYQRSFPFAEFLAGVGQREDQDIKIGEVVEFIYRELDGIGS